MTIPQLARRSGASTATVARVLRGEPTVAIGHVCAVADAVGMQVGLSRHQFDALVDRTTRDMKPLSVIHARHQPGH